jgi:hypothetical protein
MASLGYDASGKRIRKVAYGRTKTEARTKLRRQWPCGSVGWPSDRIQWGVPRPRLGIFRV